MKESNHVRGAIIAAAILFLGVPAMADASPFKGDDGKPVVRVSYADLNLSSQAGLLVLYKRLQGASSAACGPQRSLQAAGSLQQLSYNRNCYDNLLSKLVAKVDNSDLDEIHTG